MHLDSSFKDTPYTLMNVTEAVMDIRETLDAEEVVAQRGTFRKAFANDGVTMVGHNEGVKESDLRWIQEEAAYHKAAAAYAGRA